MTPSEIKKIRRTCQISRIELAAMTGLPESHIEKIEEGTIPPLGSDLQRIEKALRLIQKFSREKDDPGEPTIFSNW